MRIFWALMVTFLLITGFVMWQASQTTSPVKSSGAVASADAPTRTPSARRTPAPEPKAPDQSTPETARAARDETATIAPVEIDPAPAVVAVVDPESGDEAPTETETETEAETPNAVEDDASDDDPTVDDESTATSAVEPSELDEPDEAARADDPPAPPTTEPEVAPDPDTDDPPGAEGDDGAPAEPPASDAGAERFTTPGSGTKEDPYRVSWELLVSASESYRPREGMDEIPAWVQDLHGKYVRITGYVLIPLGAQSATEMLLMLNMWDGCCIGVPPSAYDAIEVALETPFERDPRRFFNYGAITGKLLVDPYLVNEWLVGLYLIEEGVLQEADM